MGNSDVHNHDNLPVIVAGGPARSFKGGRHIRYGELTPMANLLLTLLKCGGIHLDRFMDSTGTIDDLLA
jgi:hypothetical protein